MTLTALFSRCVNHSYIHTSTSADYAYDRVGNHLYIYFQDSDGAVDWIRNLDFPASAYKRNGRNVFYAHRGFLSVWKSLIPQMERLVTDPTLKRVTVVGYSHGAALAVLCHEYVWYHRPDLRNSLDGYGFGCPRVLWGQRPDEITGRWAAFTVIRNLNDLVTHVPPSVWGYYHVGKMMEIGKAGKYSAIDAHRSENIRKELWDYEHGVVSIQTMVPQIPSQKGSKKV